MRGSLRKRYTDSWNLILDLGYHPDPQTGQLKRKQKWYTVHGTKRDAEKKLAELLHALHQGTLVEPSKLTLGAWLDTWVETAIKPPNKRLRSYETYKSVITHHLQPALGAIRLQQLLPTDLQRYYTASSLSPTTLEQHHVIVHSALKAAHLQGLVARNVASLVLNKPRRLEDVDTVSQQCWTAAEVRRFLAVTPQAGPQMAAFYQLALDTGARKGELCGLQWGETDLERGQVAIVRQLVKPGLPPVFGPPKNGTPRTISLMSSTVDLLRRHKARQAETRLANGQSYHDFGLVFAKDWWGARTHGHTLGHPLQSNNIGQGEFQRLSVQAGLPRIPFHGLRHTCATLLLQAGVPVHVVQERLGHKRIEVTLNIYAHTLPHMQQDAADKLSSMLQA